MHHTLNYNRQTGFTLLEIVMVMFIVGLLMAPLMFFGPKMIDGYRADLTRIKADRIMVAYSNFMQKNSRMPCVSWPQVSANSPIIGAERNLAAVANWDKGCQNVDSPGIIGWAVGHGVGVVPWRSMGIPESYIFDGWGRPFQVRADPKSSTPVTNQHAWNQYNDDDNLAYSASTTQIMNGCNTAEWWNTNYANADRTEYDMDGKDNALALKTWLNNRRMSHINMPKGRLCCGAGWARDFITKYDGVGADIYTGVDWGQDMNWQAFELATVEQNWTVGYSQHDHEHNLYDQAYQYQRYNDYREVGYHRQEGNQTSMLEYSNWYQNNRVMVGNWIWDGGTPTSVGPAQTDQPISLVQALAVTLISAGPNGWGGQVFDYDGSGNCVVGQCDLNKQVQLSDAERGNGIVTGIGIFNASISDNRATTSIRHPFDPLIVNNENVAFDDLVFYSKTDHLMAASGRGTCTRP